MKHRSTAMRSDARIAAIEDVIDPVQLPCLQDLINLVPDYLWVKNREGRFLLANNAMSLDHGADSADFVIGLTDYDLHAEHMADEFSEDERRVMVTGQPMVAKDESIIGPDGQRKWLSTTKVAWRDSQGVVAGVVCIARDVTQRRNAERLRDGQSHVLGLIARNAPLESSLQGVTQMIGDFLPKALVGIQVIETDGRQTIYGSIGGLPEMFVEKLAGSASAEPVIEAVDILRHPDWKLHVQPAKARGKRFCWAIPIFFEGETLGVIAVMLPERAHPTPEDKSLLNSAAQLAGIAIERRRVAEATLRMATHDMLTELPNRTVLTERLQVAIDNSRDSGRLSALIFVDLDRFKAVNDQYGHNAGDELLRVVAKRLRQSVLDHDCVIRFAGDEFIVILANCSDEAWIMARVEQMRLSIAEPVEIAKRTISVTASVGVHICSQSEYGIDDVISKADEAMYRSKVAGRNRVAMSPTDH